MSKVDEERRALLEEYLLVCAQSKASESAFDVLAADLKIVGKRLGLHSAKALADHGVERLFGWLEQRFSK